MTKYHLTKIATFYCCCFQLAAAAAAGLRVSSNGVPPGELQELHDEFRLAAGLGDVNKFEQLLELGGKLNIDLVGGADESETTVTHLAAENGQTQILEILIREHAHVNAVDVTELTPAHLAAFHGHAEALEMLIEAGADPNVVCLLGQRPSHLAAENGRTEATRVLIQAGADMNAKNRWDSTPCHLAVEGGHLKTLEALLLGGADPNQLDALDQTPAHIAADNGYTECLSLILMDARTNCIDCGDIHEMTPCHLAAMNGHVGALQVLIDAGADIHVENDHDQKPAHVASYGPALQMLLSAALASAPVYPSITYAKTFLDGIEKNRAQKNPLDIAPVFAVRRNLELAVKVDEFMLSEKSRYMKNLFELQRNDASSEKDVFVGGDGALRDLIFSHIGIGWRNKR